MVPRWSPSNNQHTRWLLVAVLCVSSLAVGVGFVGNADAAPPPRPVCAGCGGAFEQRAGEFGLEVRVTNSTARVTVHENGTGVWTVRNAVEGTDALARLRQNATLRAEIADARYWEVEVLSTNVTADGVFTARYRDGDFARGAIEGTMISGTLTDHHGSGYRNLHGLGADRLVVVAPDGMHIEQTVPGATLTADRSRTVLTEYERGGFVTFVPDGATLSFLSGWLAIASILGPTAVLNAVVAVALPAAVVGGSVGASTPILRKAVSILAGLLDSPGTVLGVLGVVGLAGSLAAGAVGMSGVFAATVFGLSGVAAVAGLAWRHAGQADLTFRRVVVLSTLCACGGAALAVAGSVLFSGQLLFGVATRLPMFVALFALVPAGFAVQRGNPRRGVSVAVFGVALALFLVVPLTANYWPMGPLRRVLVGTLDALALTVAGVPFLAVGALAGARE